MEKLQSQHFQGLLVMVLITGLSYGLSETTGILGSVVWGLLLGILGGNLIQTPSAWKPGIVFSEKTVLAYAIILMGIQTGIAFQSSTPWETGLIVIAVMTIAIISGLLLYKRFNLSKDDGILLGVGNAVCGASAIAAISGIIKADAKSTGTGIAIVNLLGVLGLIIIPSVLANMDLNVIEKALYTGGTLQAVGQAVAAGNTLGSDVGIWATTIKMFRVGMLLPVALIFAFTQSRSNGTNKPSLKLIPTFLWLFILTSAIGAFLPLPDSFTDLVHTIEKIILTIAMVAIGWQIKLSKLWTEGPVRLLLGVIIFVIQLAVMTGLIILVQPQV
ncbi:YeiH family protein [Phaeocystidibacter marisrubri]|uniref:Putative sulfate exporter family transporter n=1 Tax=Phaeocystidibacter marisrubri TaxID=1577780 RepID=A0A6L3ZJG8_9FLAO|nr:putative sulfate exporter family transporter [Phaeocystidibacter marisrubri]KAB2818166.1 putative sulfate exporter family transporter [Phaeocystidibacter marisrubri]